MIVNILGTRTSLYMYSFINCVIVNHLPRVDYNSPGADVR